MRISQFNLCHLFRWHFNFSKMQDEHDLHVLQVLCMFDQHGLLTSVDKCEFNKESLEYLGFIIGKNGVSMHPSKLATISNWPLPHSVKEVQCFLGLTNFYQHFISHYASIAVPLYDLTCKDSPSPFTLTSNAISAFHSLKSMFQSAPILIHHNPQNPSIYLPMCLTMLCLEFHINLAMMASYIHWDFSHENSVTLRSTMMSMTKKCCQSWNLLLNSGLGYLGLKYLSPSLLTIRIFNISWHLAISIDDRHDGHWN